MNLVDTFIALEEDLVPGKREREDAEQNPTDHPVFLVAVNIHLSRSLHVSFLWVTHLPHLQAPSGKKQRESRVQSAS